MNCAPQRNKAAKRNLTGIFQHWDALDPEWNPGGIWRPIRIVTTGPVRIDRESSSRMAVVRANVRDRDLVGFVDEAKAAVAQQVPLPPGVRLAWGGQFENQQRAAARLMLVVPVVLALIVLILFLTLGSLRQALLVLANVPFALVGGVLALALAGEYVSVPASVGFIALLGIAVLNGVVMVTHFNERLANGEDIAQVVRLGSERRLRPVLMTATITALGMLPLLFATGPGSEIQKPLAVVVIGVRVFLAGGRVGRGVLAARGPAGAEATVAAA